MMKNMTRRTFLAALGVTTATLLVGCGDSTDSTSSSSTTNSNASTTSGDTVEEDTSVDVSATGLTEETIRSYPETDASYFTTSPVEGGVSITGCTSTDEVIVIPETIGGATVLTIASSAFSKTEYRGVVLPDTVTEIEKYAFASMELLEAIWLGTGIVTVGASVFNSCPLLKTVTFPEGTTTFGGLVFGLCPELERIYLPASLVNFVAIASTGDCPNVIYVTPAGSDVEAYAIKQEFPCETY